jgi:tRNA nucleotidyltransferase (CCA-adding enzyme)
MGRQHVGHQDIVRFAEERVNLKREDAMELRDQANRLRDKLDGYLEEHPDFELRKMVLSGSLAKGTALKSVSDIDVGCYVSSDSAPQKISALPCHLQGRDGAVLAEGFWIELQRVSDFDEQKLHDQ